ncbi:hypothetical protein Pcinc_013277 [Petrolisthes cinctipes]|uniref:Uncharacterized protein n=1 Tax=Petrolisthes cinctipes TaxID=88211 RepID=A0AAE1FZG2_PETCI|nr:hypothetical protein Pcinc_013277 [Petrolisthes cinctipes]
MEQRPPPASTTLHNKKGTTLPGYRVGSVRYGVRLAPHNDPLTPSSSTRRCSEGDLGTPGRYGAAGEKDDEDDGGGMTNQPLVDNGSHLAPGEEAVRTNRSSPLHLKEAHSLLNNRWTPLTVPTTTPMLPPTSPRPAALRRSFNASPRPWVAPGYSANHTLIPEPPTHNTEDRYCDKRDVVSGKWAAVATDGAGVHHSTNEPQPAQLKLSTHPPEGDEAPSSTGVADVATFRSEATIVVTQGGKGVSQGARSPLSRRRGVGIFTLTKVSEGNGEGPGDAAAGGAAVVDEVRADGLPTPTSKYMCCVAGRSPRHPLPRHATMFSCPGPARPAITQEAASAHLASEQSTASPTSTPSHAHGSAASCEVFPVEGEGSVAPGGSGHGDRVAPPAPVTGHTHSPAPTHSAIPTRRPVRPRPEIPDHLYRRWAALLPADAVLNHLTRDRPLTEVGAGAPGGTAPPDVGFRPVTPTNLVPGAGGTHRSPIRVQRNASEESAQPRLGTSTAGLGGGRREGGHGPPPARPPRSRPNHLEELRKCTERLKSPSPDKKMRADSAPPPDTAATSATQERGGGAGVSRSRRLSNDTRSAHNPHATLGKSPSLPPHLPSAKVEVSRLSPTPILKDPGVADPQSARREDEDMFHEDAARLPPRPRPEARVIIPPRVIPFRSASVSQVDVSSDGALLPRSTKSPTAIRLYPLCKDYWGANTLPKRKPVMSTTEGSGGTGGSSQHRHPQLTAAASITDMTNVGAKAAAHQHPDKLENKSKSESELSVKGLKVEGSDLSDLRDSLLSQKVEDSGVLGCSKEGNNASGKGDGVCRGEDERVRAGPGEVIHTQQTKNDNSEIKELNSEKDREDMTRALKMEKKESTSRKKEGKEKDGNKSNRVSFSDEVKNISVDSEGNTSLQMSDLSGSGSEVVAGQTQSLPPEGEGGSGAPIGPPVSDEHRKIIFSLGNEETDEGLSCMSTEVHLQPASTTQNEVGMVALPSPPIRFEERSEGLGAVGGDIHERETRDNDLSLTREIFSPERVVHHSHATTIVHDSYGGASRDVSCKTLGDSVVTGNPPARLRGETRLSIFPHHGQVRGGEGEGSGHRQLECQVVQKEARLSQCLVIKSGAGEGGQHSPGGGQGATSECRVVTSRPRLLRDDSDGDSRERESSRTYMTQVSNDGTFEEELKSPERDSSDSSSQDSVGAGQDMIQDPPLRTGSRRRRKLTGEGDDRSLTFPPPRKSSQVDALLYPAIGSQEIGSVGGSESGVERGSGEGNQSSFSITHSLLSEAGNSPDPRQLLLLSEPRLMDRAERKKKHHSDPSCERRGSSDAFLYLSDQILGLSGSTGPPQRHPPKGVVSQASTDSEGKDERGDQPAMSPPRVCTPQVLLSGHDSDGSDYRPCRTPARNASPTPYLPDSDSGERSAPRSPHVPRRYSKRPLRGPYGEMLEAEMSKSKSSSSFLTEDSYLRVRDAKSCSPRPPSPASPAVLGERPPLIIPTCRSLDDSVIAINYADSERSLRRKVSEEPEGGTTSPGGPWESDGEGNLSPLPLAPVHHRTVSSPSKLFSEGGFTSEDEQELVEYYSAAARRLAQQNNQKLQQQEQEQEQEHQRQQEERPQEQPQQQLQEPQQQQPQPQQHQQQVQQPSSQQEGGEPRHSHLDHRHTEHRHSHKRHRVSTVTLLSP